MGHAGPHGGRVVATGVKTFCVAAAWMPHRPRHASEDFCMSRRRRTNRRAIEPRPGQFILRSPGRQTAAHDRAGWPSATHRNRRDLAAACGPVSRRQDALIEPMRYVRRGALATGPLRLVGTFLTTLHALAVALCRLQKRDRSTLHFKEVGERWSRHGGKRTAASVMLQFRYRLTKLFDVPREAFKPVPQVTSSLVRMQPIAVTELHNVDAKAFARVVAAAFGQRRKTLRNALSELLTTEQIVESGVDPQARAETLGVQSFVELAHARIN